MVDVLERVRRGLREHADSIDPVPPMFVPVQLVVRQPRPRRRLVPAFAAAGLVAVAAIPAVLLGPGPAAAGPVLPREFDVPAKYVTELSAQPLSLAVATMRVEDQLVAVGADGHEYRSVDVPDGPTLLSGDGTKIAAQGPDVSVLDVRKGRSRSYPVGVPGLVTPLAWSLDSRTLAVSGGGRLALLDTETGASRVVAATGAVEAAAFSWDGRLLATQVAPPDPTVTIVDPISGVVLRRIPVWPGYRLAGQQAWSPDGAALAVVAGNDGPIQYVDAATGVVPSAAAALSIEDAGRPAPEAPSGRFLGWRSTETFAFLRATEIRESNGALLSIVDRARVGSVQLAFALLPAVRVEDLDRPALVRWVGVAVAVPLLLVLIARYLRRPTGVSPRSRPS